MIFIETPIFTEELKSLLPDEEYRAFQVFLATNPEKGDIIQGTGGLRKIRWRGLGKGKRGGVRIIYYYLMRESQIRLLLIYKKGMKDNLTVKEKHVLRVLNERW